MRRILFFLLLIVLLNACDKEKYYNVDKNTWFLMSENDTIVFYSENLVDSFYISNIQEYYECVDKDNYFQHLDIYLDKIGLDATHNTWNCNVLRNHKSIQVNWINFYGSANYSYDNFILYQIEDREFNKVFKMDNFSQYVSDLDVKALYYTDLYGVIAYELYNGEVYEIDLNCLP